MKYKIEQCEYDESLDNGIILWHVVDESGKEVGGFPRESVQGCEEIIKELEAVSAAASTLGKRKSEAKTKANRAKANLPPKVGKKPRGRPKTQPTQREPDLKLRA